MARRKYEDTQINDSILDTPEYQLHLGGPRRYDPDGGASTEEGAHLSLLTEFCSGDWSWKPHRDKIIGENFRTFKGVPPSAAELYGRRSYSPA